MSLFSGFNISASGLTANRMRMDVVSANIANANTNRAELVDGEWVPYRRKSVELSQSGTSPFANQLQSAMNRGNTAVTGVNVSEIREDQTPFTLTYDPEHPDAGEDGYVRSSNVDPLKEMVDLMSATRSYEANVTALNASKSMFMKALEIGK
ncbi:flagellar basal body rod protein FlgC [Planococcus kocurii]|uniref:Flagellar basal-body rod protein FlgC n=2 Tax=Planococcus TaxID=1372 RepID=A0ABN4JYX3_9BACL|nr:MULTISPECIES: flagellar basal body rod protein FlgC [Planococcus]ALS80029.1 flagellar basal-body rod protein FlgC [Planococcus kocurii]AQU77987.1 flagellar basal body rod protein FlgC [Planococcus faecalis]KAA0957452.1 flagellar basal body rod protein FlgC [Planococcus sp. ANT_H30]